MHDTVYHNYARLHSLNTLNRWVSYSGKPVKVGKIDKAPINPKTGQLAANNRPATWGSKAQAERHARTLKSPGSKPGVGIVLGPLDERIALCGVDLDGCMVDGTLEPWAEEIRAKLASYTEISPSGEGAKIFFLVKTSDLPALRRTLGAEHRQQWKKGVALQHRTSPVNSYFTVTGQEYGADPNAPDTSAQATS
jgi:primase-polymerase (primpol)-like protein